MSKTRKDILSGSGTPKKKEIRDTGWRCADCGKHNNSRFVQCNYCGAYEEE